MSNADSIRDLLVRGIAAAKAGERDEARMFLEWVLRRDAGTSTDNEAYWWLSQISLDLKEKRGYLEEILVRDPTHPLARRELAILDGRLDPAAIVNPDRLGELGVAEPVPGAGKRTVCPRCGGRMVYTPNGASLVCDFCGWRRSIEGRSLAAEGDFVVAMATARGHRQPVAARTFTCAGCGSGFLVAAETLAFHCPYCGSAYVGENTSTQEIIPPDGLIPFRIDAVKAESIRRGRRGAPPATGLGVLQGIYTPVWSFDLSGQVLWQGERYEADRECVPASGAQLVAVKDHLVPASRRLREVWPRAPLRFDPARAVAYDSAYLVSWPAETYQVSMSDAAVVARGEVFAKIRAGIERDQGREIRNLRFDSTGFTIDSFQLILVPLWIGLGAGPVPAPELVINGDNGEVQGEEKDGRQKSWLSWWLRGE